MAAKFEILSLYRHTKIVHEGLKNYKCDLCDKAFSQLSNVKAHIKSVHEGIKNHKCDFCEKAFSEHGTLKRHISSFHYSYTEKSLIS